MASDAPVTPARDKWDETTRDSLTSLVLFAAGQDGAILENAQRAGLFLPFIS